MAPESRASQPAGKSESVDGVLVVDKPAGKTSFDVVALVRRLLETRRAGHTGTLDPFATGVLPVCLGLSTRIVPFLTEGDKAYEATLKLGEATDTQDGTGEVISRAPVPALTPEDLEVALSRLRGPLLQAPPMYSAVRVGGRRLYELAREGQVVEREARPVTVYELALRRFEPPVLSLFVRCSKGTYVRTLAHDLGEALGCGAHLTALRRTVSAGFGIHQAVSLKELGRRGAEAARARLLSEAEALSFLPAFDVDAASARKVCSGQRLARGDLPGLDALPEGGRLRLMGTGGELLAVAERRAGAVHYLRVLAGPRS
jgi:tRNA pseudouridine55 synthase